MNKIKRFLYLIYAKIVCAFWSYKLGLKYRDLKGVWLALEQMIKLKQWEK